MRTVVAATLVALLSLAPAAAQDADADPGAALARLQQNFESYERTRERLAALEAEYARGINSRDLAGDNRAAVVAGIADAKRELAATREAHEELFEAARRSGVPWNELDRYEELPAPPAAPLRGEAEEPDALDTGSEAIDDVPLEGAEDSDGLEADSTGLDQAGSEDGEALDDMDSGRSEDSDAMRATSRDPD